MYQVVIDTNVLVAALLSSLGASHRLLRLVGDDRWRINLSVPLVLEYEQTLKRVCTGGSLSGSDIDDVLRFLCANANLRLIFFLWRPFLPDPKDDFVLELAVESRADFLVTFNTRDFVGRALRRSGNLAAGIPCDNRGDTMTLNVTVPDAVYRQITDLAARQQVSVERVVAAALAEQLSGWARVEQMGELGSRERFLAALDKVPAAEPVPEDRL